MTPEQRACQAYTDALGLKKGDRVRIQGFHTGHTYGWANEWRTSMDSTLGKIGVVVEVLDSARGVRVAMEHNELLSWVYPPYVLARLPEKKVRPYNNEELRQLIGKALVFGDTKSPSLVVEVVSGYVLLSVGGQIVKRSSQELLSWKQLPDLTVCGVEE